MPRPLGEASWAALGTNAHPLVPVGPPGDTPPELRHQKNNNLIIVSIFPRGAEFGMGGSKQFRRTQNFSIKNANLVLRAAFLTQCLG